MSKIIIGNKPYKKLQVNKLLDSFRTNIRCNMGIPKENNGSIKDELAVCSHIFDYFIKQKSDWDTVVKVYGEEYKEEYLKYFYDNFSIKDYKSVWYADASNVCGKYNDFLERKKCPYKFSKQPRTGFVCVLENVLSGGCPFIFGFSLTKETRKSYYVNDFVFKKEDSGKSCHDKESEVNILRWLHKNNYIDATLCMLKDTNPTTIGSTGLKPSLEMIDLLNHVYGNIINEETN